MEEVMSQQTKESRKDTKEEMTLPRTKESREDTKKVAAQPEKVLFMILTYIFILGMSMFIGGTLMESYGLAVGGAIGIMLIGFGFRFFTLSVPNATGAITLNFITGNEIPYGPGLWFKFPWETIDEYYPLTIYTEETTCESAARDGPNMHVKFSIQWP